MKLKHIILCAVGLLALSACDNIPEDNRYLDADFTLTDRVVLLTEFTGMRCVNCPDAAAIANNIAENYPDNFIVVAMHPKGHGFVPEGTTPDLAREVAMDYLKSVGGSITTALPSGVIDFTKTESSYLVDRSTWMANVIKRATIAPDCIIGLEHSATDERHHTVKVTLDPRETLNQKVSLVMWLIESGMVGSQASHEHGTIKDYVHNHALRECLNGLWGDELGNIAGQTEKEYTFTIAEEYVPDNCSVVAVLVDTDTHEVVQAGEIALGNGSH
ncbi:MAG: Omp28 family outer membrane lipoprotein [Candidatus Aphodosoma sp.]